MKIPRFDRPPVIDGKLDDEVWKQAAKLKDFYQTTPGDNIAPSQPTEVFLGYDQEMTRANNDWSAYREHPSFYSGCMLRTYARTPRVR